MASPFSRTTRSLTLDSSHFALIVLLVAGAGLLAWLVWFGVGNVTVYEVSRQARLESDSAPRDVSAFQPGRLVASTLEIGRGVHAGDVLIELDSATEKSRLQEEDARLSSYPSKIDSLRRQIAALQDATVNDQRAAEAAIQSAEAHLSEASATADFAGDNERRMQTESGAGSVAEIDALRATSDARKAISARDAFAADARKLALDAQTRARQSEAQIEDLKRTLVSLESDATSSREAIARLKLDIENHRVRAPVDGVIGETLPLRPGAYVAQGQKLATIVPSGALLIVAEFNPASALGRVRPGQTARLRLDGFPWAQYGSVDATVLRVSDEIRDNFLRVELTPVAQSQTAVVMRHGLTGSVEVGIESVSPAVLLLRAAGQLVESPAHPPVRTVGAEP